MQQQTARWKTTRNIKKHQKKHHGNTQCQTTKTQSSNEIKTRKTKTYIIQHMEHMLKQCNCQNNAIAHASNNASIRTNNIAQNKQIHMT